MTHSASIDLCRKLHADLAEIAAHVREWCIEQGVCPEDYGTLVYEPPRPAETDTGVPVWHGGVVCDTCGWSRENPPPDTESAYVAERDERAIEEGKR